jgi:galactokinase/mevalonate kinase-like predicted kinase
MPIVPEPWDYLILTASHAAQAAAYTMQLDVRRKLGLLSDVRNALAVADPPGQRIGSGASTLLCLMEVLNRELAGRPDLDQSEVWDDVLRRLRILIIHAGGDSRRLPAYGPCGKVFLPLPGDGGSALGNTLFDRQAPLYLQLPPLPSGSGQVVVTAGDVLLGFSPEDVAFLPDGLTGLGCPSSPEQACGHGVYCAEKTGQVRRFLQKPSLEDQQRLGAIDDFGQVVLDIGVVNFDAVTAVELLELFRTRIGPSGRLEWTGPLAAAILEQGLNFYREICCAAGAESDFATYCGAVRDSGSAWSDDQLRQVFDVVSRIPFRVQVLKKCHFLHFGSTQQIIASGQELRRQQDSFASPRSCLSINNRLQRSTQLTARDAWVEGCSIENQLTLGGGNVVVGVDVHEALQLPPRACLDVLPGWNRQGGHVHFIRCYLDDEPQHGPADNALCGLLLSRWLRACEAGPEELWESTLPVPQRQVWNARLFPAETAADGYRRWLWMFQPQAASAQQFQAWRRADRYSLAEMADRVDPQAFFDRRMQTRGAEIRHSLRTYFRSDSSFSAADLAQLLARAGQREPWFAAIVAEARRHWENSGAATAEEAFAFSRIIHSLGSALAQWVDRPAATLVEQFPRLSEVLGPADAEWLAELQLAPDPQRTLEDWISRAHAVAFEYLRHEILHSVARPDKPRIALREDEIVWGRSPVRLDLAGGWSDTPPFALEQGGCVLNAAVTLNDQPPIQVYARRLAEPLLRMRSIDGGGQAEIRTWDQLLDYPSAQSEFALVKAALALFAFVPTDSARRGSLREMLKQFGGGLEITTLAAVPKGSGLGASSIMGAVLTAVVHRLLGRPLSPAESFHAVLQLEQALTTGGGWQDQIGGSVAGLKLISTAPGLVPEASIRYVPADILDPQTNGGRTLLYYTGMTRLAKNILQRIVGRYLDRDRDALDTLHRIQGLAMQMTEAVARKDLAEFGRLIDAAWQLNQRLDPHTTNAEVERILEQVRGHIYGAKLLGAGDGGFLLLVCKSSEDAERARALLLATPPNPRARFFDFAVSSTGLAVTVC